MTTSLTNSKDNKLAINGTPIIPSDVKKAQKLLQTTFTDLNVPQAKYNVLWMLVKEENWSKERLERTIKWFLKNRKSFAKEWQISEFFNYNCKLFSHSWYLAQIDGNVDANKNIEKWRLDDGSVAYKYKDGVDLPYEYLGTCDGRK